MKNQVLFVVLAATIFAGCKKEIKSLPDATQTGAGTFGAKIDGENWGPLKAGILPTLPILEAHFSNDSSVFINARNFSRTPVETEMEIYLKHVTGPGVIALDQTTEIAPSQTASYAYYVKRNISVTDDWTTSASGTGTVILTKIDWQGKIISGTFQFKANARYGSAPTTVTEGRFDIKVQ